MEGRAPREWEVERAIEDCLDEHDRYESLSALHAAVSRKLSERGLSKGTTPERIRRIGVQKGLFAFEIRYSRSATMRLHESCPVCGGRLSVTYNRTIDDSSVVVMGARCRRCGYSAGSGFVKPCRYIVRALRWTGRRGSRPSARPRGC